MSPMMGIPFLCWIVGIKMSWGFWRNWVLNMKSQVSKTRFINFWIILSLALQQMDPTLFDQLSQISLRVSQMTRCSEESDQTSQVSAEVASSSNSNMRTDSGVITEQPSSSRTRSISQRKPKRGPWETYLATKPLMPAGKANQSRMVSSRRHSIEVSLRLIFPIEFITFPFSGRTWICQAQLHV